jgi:AcrR family transcriptional regulator
MQGSMRDRILAAAVSVIKERGVTNTTTKEIARAAGVAEGSIYNHFANKTELVGACMAEVAGGIRDALARLSGRAGQGTVEDNLTELAEAEIAFFTDFLPVVGPILGDHDLREWLRAGGPHDHAPSVPTGTPVSRRQDGSPPRRSHDRPGPDTTGSTGPYGAAPPAGFGPPGTPPGPVIGHAVLIGYLEAERGAGRLAPDAPAAYLAVSIIGACQQYSFVRLLTAPDAMTGLAGLPQDPAEYARTAVRAVMAGHLTQDVTGSNPE